MDAGTITFGNQCDTPFTFETTTQTSITPDPVYKYTGADLLWDLTPFTITPVICADTIVYSCTDIKD